MRRAKMYPELREFPTQTLSLFEECSGWDIFQHLPFLWERVNLLEDISRPYRKKFLIERKVYESGMIPELRNRMIVRWAIRKANLLLGWLRTGQRYGWNKLEDRPRIDFLTKFRDRFIEVSLVENAQ